MHKFCNLELALERTVIAPGGSDVRVLLGLPGGSMAHFQLAPGKVSQAVTHRTVEEIWFCLFGEGEMWRKQDEREEVIWLKPGLCLTIPLGTHFQFRTLENSSFAQSPSPCRHGRAKVKLYEFQESEILQLSKFPTAAFACVQR